MNHAQQCLLEFKQDATHGPFLPDTSDRLKADLRALAGSIYLNATDGG